MYTRCPISPLTFEPLSPTASDLIFDPLDSETELDPTARAAKRIRVEQIGRDYLEGKPPFILTASLNGPFDDGWINPWSKKRGQQQQQGRDYNHKRTSTAGKPSERIPAVSESPTKSPRNGDSATTNLSLLSPDKTPRSPFQAQSAESGCQLVYMKVENKNKGRQISQSPGAGRRAPSRVSSNPSSSIKNPRIRAERLRSTSYKGSRSDWLKKDQSTPNHRAMDPPGSPTPTPSTRPATGPTTASRSGQYSKASQSHNRLATFSDKSKEALPISEMRTSGFTAVNSPQPRNVSANEPVRIQPNSQISGHVIKTPGEFNRTPVSKRRVPKLGYRSRNVSSNQTIPETYQKKDHSKTNKIRKTSILKQPVKETTVNASSPPTFSDLTTQSHPSAPVPKSTSADITPGDGTVGSWGHGIAKQPESACTNTKSGPAVPPPSSRETLKISSVMTGSNNIPSAQVVPDHFRFQSQITPLDSMDLIMTNDQNQGPQTSNNHTFDNHHITASAAQSSAKYKGTTPVGPPLKAGPSHLDEHPRSSSAPSYVSPGQIKPFHSFHQDELEPGTSENHMTENALHNNKPNARTRHDPNIAKTLRRVNAANPSSNAQDDTTAQQPHKQASFPPEKPTESPCIIHNAPQREFSDLQSSSGTILPFTLSPSTNNTTKQQDGQGAFAPIDNFENFDLSQAINDAGSFLQSWDIEKDRLGIKRSTNLEASGPNCENTSSILKTNMA